MRRLPLALAGASLVAVGLAVPAAHGSTPSSSTLTVPASSGQSAHVNYTGTIEPGTNPTNNCSDEGGATADKHTVTIKAPAGGYHDVDAVFAFAITWTPNVAETTSDEILTVLAPDGSPLGSSDSGATTEALTVNNLPSGTYTMLACGFANTAPQNYKGSVLVKTKHAAAKGVVSTTQHTINDKTLSFAPATVVDPILFGGEPGITFDPTTDGSRQYVDWPVSSRTNIGVFFRSTDGGLSFTKRYADVTDVAGELGPLCLGRQVPYCPTGGGGDTDTQVDPANGHIYFSSQEALANEAAGTSFDHGTTFPASHADPVTQKAGGDVDRQWLGFWKGTNTVFLAYHSPIVGAYVVRSDQAGKTGTWSIPPVPQIPFVAQTGAMEVDNTGGIHNHTIYLSYLSAKPNPTSILDESPHIAVSTDGAKTFQTYKLPNLLTGGADDSVHNFIKIFLDSAGNLYEVQTDSTTNATYLSTSLARAPGNLTHPGSVWKGPYQVSAAPANLTIFPDVRAGSPGRIGVIYYGSNANAATPDDVKPGDGGWYPYVSFSGNALCMWSLTNACKSPTFHQTTITPKINQDDNICTSGTACAATMGNRSLADYWDIDVDRGGHLGFVWSDTTNAIGGPFVKVTRQITGPSLYAGLPNASLPDRGNGYPDAAGDAKYPIAGAKILTAKNHPTLDLRGTTVAVKGSQLEFTIKLNSGANLGAGVPTGNDGLTPLRQAKYIVRWDWGNDAFYAGANVPAGGTPSYFSGKVSSQEGILSPTNPDNAFAFGNRYAPLGPAAGKVVGNNMVIDVPLSAVGSPKLGSPLLNVGTYSMVGPNDAAVILETLPITVDASPTFNTQLAPAPNSPGSTGTPGSPGTPTSGGGNGSSAGGSLAATGGSAALGGVGVLLLLAALLLGRRRRTA
jgi:hypothetical protein